MPVVGQPLPLHELTGFPCAFVLAKTPPEELLAVALLTSPTLITELGGFPSPELTAQVANVTGLAQEDGAAGFEVTINVSVAKLPVSVDVLINK